MKRLGWMLLIISGMCLAQGTPAQQAQPPANRQANIVRGVVGSAPTSSDMYCAGFITTEKVPESHYLVGGWNSPDQAHYAGTTDIVYIYGPQLKVGDRMEIVRRVKDPNHYEFFRGAKSAVRDIGQPYFERGYVRVINVQNNIAAAVPELSCGDMVPGDLVVPWVEREKPVFRQVAVDRFALQNGKPTGRIVMSDEFDGMVGTGHKVYLNIGSDKGLKVGDYLAATRTYEYSYHDVEAGLSTRATVMDDTQYQPPKFSKGDIHLLPRRTLGNMVVLQVHPRSATAMIVASLEDIHVGDGVELLDVGNAPPISSSSSGATAEERTSTAAVATTGGKAGAK